MLHIINPEFGRVVAESLRRHRINRMTLLDRRAPKGFWEDVHKRLTQNGIPAPRGGKWHDSAHVSTHYRRNYRDVNHHIEKYFLRLNEYEASLPECRVSTSSDSERVLVAGNLQEIATKRDLDVAIETLKEVIHSEIWSSVVLPQIYSERAPGDPSPPFQKDERIKKFVLLDATTPSGLMETMKLAVAILEDKSDERGIVALIETLLNALKDMGLSVYAKRGDVAGNSGGREAALHIRIGQRGYKLQITPSI